jgi:hypothetical protein
MSTRNRSTRTPTRLIALAAMLLVAVMATAGVAIAQRHHHHHGDRHHDDPAGTIQSYDSNSGLLTIDLGQGGSTSGLVTKLTWIDDASDHHDCGDDDDSRRGRCFGRHNGDGDWGDHDRGDASDLQPGTTVDDAVLVLKDGRAFYVKVDLDD